MDRRMLALALSPPGCWQAGHPCADPSHPGSRLRPCCQPLGCSGDGRSSSSTPGCCTCPGKAAAPRCRGGFTCPGHGWQQDLQLGDAPLLPPPPFPIASSSASTQHPRSAAQIPHCSPKWRELVRCHIQPCSLCLPLAQPHVSSGTSSAGCSQLGPGEADGAAWMRPPGSCLHYL